jgi:hypothetical protein
LREVAADLADLVWVQLIKDSNPSLYRWIENYCATASALYLGTARVEEAERKRDLEALKQCDDAGDFKDKSYRFQFAQQLPGLESDFSSDEPGFEIFQDVSEDERGSAIRDARLASPDHYRLYFALDEASHALTAEDVVAFKHATETNAEATRTLLLKWQKEGIQKSLGKSDILLERMRGGLHEILSPTQCYNFLLALANSMDDARRIKPFDQFWINSIWDRAERLVRVLLPRLGASERKAALATMFGEGTAISWLTDLLRHETSAHGKFGATQKQHDSDWLITDPEFDRISSQMLSRYRAMSPQEVFSMIEPLKMLFVWRHNGSEGEPRKLVDDFIVSDEGLVAALGGMTSTVNSSDRGKYKVLSRNNLMPFLDYDNARKRIQALVADSTAGFDVEKIKEISAALQDGDD